MHRRQDVIHARRGSGVAVCRSVVHRWWWHVVYSGRHGIRVTKGPYCDSGRRSTGRLGTGGEWPDHLYVVPTFPGFLDQSDEHGSPGCAESVAPKTLCKMMSANTGVYSRLLLCSPTVSLHRLVSVPDIYAPTLPIGTVLPCHGTTRCVQLDLVFDILPVIIVGYLHSIRKRPSRLSTVVDQRSQQ